MATCCKYSILQLNQVSCKRYEVFNILWLLLGHPVSPKCIVGWLVAYTVAKYLRVLSFSTETEEQK